LKTQAVAFDMDGTLYSSQPLIEKVYADSILEYNQKFCQNLVPPTFKQIETWIGQPVRDIYLGLFPGITEELMFHLGAIIGREFKTAIAQKGGLLFDGVQEVFSGLVQKGMLILLASNGKREYLQAIINKFNLNIEPFVCVGESGIVNKGQILKYYLDFYEMQPTDLIMVGDRESDFKAARDAGCYFIGCNFGHGEAHEIQGADSLISNLTEITGVIEKWLAQNRLAQKR